ncbi:MAG: hypothetical protein J1E40_02450 [Oscillospiraceae bacterium]|nr:hypothetical protein [Oscillospiraceae bacterium]
MIMWDICSPAPFAVESVHNLHDDSVDLKKIIEESIRTVDSRFEVSFDYDVSGNRKDHC